MQLNALCGWVVKGLEFLAKNQKYGNLGGYKASNPWRLTVCLFVNLSQFFDILDLGIQFTNHRSKLLFYLQCFDYL